MKEKFLQIPEPLRRHILVRCGGCVLGIAMLIIVLAYQGDWRFLLPCAILSLVCLGSAVALYDLCVQNKFVVIEGVFTDIEKVALCKRVKAIYVRNEQFNIKLLNTRKIKNLSVGDAVIVYIADNAAVYEIDGCKVICSYLAMIKGGQRT